MKEITFMGSGSWAIEVPTASLRGIAGIGLKPNPSKRTRQELREAGLLRIRDDSQEVFCGWPSHMLDIPGMCKPRSLVFVQGHRASRWAATLEGVSAETLGEVTSITLLFEEQS